MDVFVVWTRCAGSASGTALKSVACEECGTTYTYSLERAALGHGWSFYGLDLEGARRRAEERARKALERRLARGQEVVPCPKCGWIQAGMIRLERRSHRRWIDTAGWFIAFLAIAAAFLNAATATGAPPRRLLVPWAAVVSVAAVGAGLVAVRHALAAAHDPNAAPLEERLIRARRLARVREGSEEHARDLPPSG